MTRIPQTPLSFSSVSHTCPLLQFIKERCCRIYYTTDKHQDFLHALIVEKGSGHSKLSVLAKGVRCKICGIN